MTTTERDLVLSIINYYKENITSDNNEKDSLLKSWIEQLNPVIHTKRVQELSQKISDIINKKESSSTHTHDMMLNTLNCIIEKGITWGGIIISFAFAALVAKQCNPSDSDHVTQIFIEHTIKTLNSWIINNGGWDYFCQAKTPFGIFVGMVLSFYSMFRESR